MAVTEEFRIERARGNGARGHEAEGANVGEVERWASMLGGGALALYGLRRGSVAGAMMALAGGTLVYRGATGHCPAYGALGVSTAESGGVTLEQSMTIYRPVEAVYPFCRDFENLPRFMENLESVTRIGEGRWHWVAKAPLGMRLEWDTEIVEDRENAYLAWRSLPGSQIEQAGRERFTEAPGGRGTEVHVVLEYRLPGGQIGTALTKLLGKAPEQMLREDLRRFKQVLEAGEVPTTTGQASGRK
jgi:uncharacterized membrane protein